MREYFILKWRKCLLWPGVFFSLGAVIRFHGLDRSLGGWDENEFLLSWAYFPIHHILTEFTSGGHQIFHTILVRIMVVVFGEENEIAIRFPAFAFGLAGLWVVYHTAKILFSDSRVAKVALTLAAFCPIHIHYSQTARGYSLIMFFSSAMIYCTIRFLDSKKLFFWGSLLVLNGFLSVYTMLTNVHFISGLAVWIGLVLTLPNLANEFGFGSKERGQRAFEVLILFMAMGGITLLVYFPILDKVFEAANNYYMPQVAHDSLLVIQGKALGMLFRGPLIWFLPFLIIGLIWGKTRRKSYFFLPITFLLTPFITSGLSGFTGFPRNYLFHFPLFIIFLSAGIIQTGEYFRKVALDKIFTFSLVIAFCLTSFHYIFFRQFSHMKIADGREYKKIIKEFSRLHDLILIPNPSNYLYAQTVYKENLSRIFNHNQLSGIKMIASTENEVKNYSLNNGFRDIPFKWIFQNRSYNLKLLNGQRILFSVSDLPTEGSFKEDFESSGNWTQIQGNGNIKIDRSRYLTGQHALMVTAGSKSDMILQTPDSAVMVFKNPALAVLVWAGKNIDAVAGSGHLLVNPQIIIRENRSGKRLSVHMTRVNQGIPNYISEPDSLQSHWTIAAQLGVIPKGNYSISLRIGAVKNQKILYDGFRFFLVNWPYGKNHDFLK